MVKVWLGLSTKTTWLRSRKECGQSVCPPCWSRLKYLSNYWRDWQKVYIILNLVGHILFLGDLLYSIWSCVLPLFQHSFVLRPLFNQACPRTHIKEKPVISPADPRVTMASEQGEHFSTSRAEFNPLWTETVLEQDTDHFCGWPRALAYRGQ